MDRLIYPFLFSKYFILSSNFKISCLRRFIISIANTPSFEYSIDLNPSLSVWTTSGNMFSTSCAIRPILYDSDVSSLYINRQGDMSSINLYVS